ncbi:MAG TPA: cache domain-containing protein, partial [bacterium]|nr:cache domain-containing protein [bacterium]
MPLRFRIFAGFSLIVLLVGVIIFFYGRYFIAQNVIGRAQREVARSLKAAWSEYRHELDRLALVTDFLTRFHAVKAIDNNRRVEAIKERYNLDYVLIEHPTAEKLPAGVTTETKMLTAEELRRISPELARRAIIKDQPTPMARTTVLGELRDALVIEGSAPIFDQQGIPRGILRVGKMLNRNFALVDRIQETIFGKQTSDGKPTGTVTIFLGERRIATTVLTDTGERAIGTFLSCAVSDKLYGQGLSWNDRAFVVNDWYLTAYDPIRSRDGKIIGILYVGILERPFIRIKEQMYFNLGLLLLSVVLVCLFLSYRIASGITIPVLKVTSAAQALSRGNWEVRVRTPTSVDEINILSETFNMMAEELQRERQALIEANQKLEAANRNYLNMVGFVSHELKGVLGSIIMNIYALKDGYLGTLNPSQQKALNAAARSLEHFEMMVKNYLDLSRIEKGELKLTRQTLNLFEDVIKPCLATFEKPLQEKKMRVEKEVPPDLVLSGDRSLLQIVFNNLFSNAIKYGAAGGLIKITCRKEKGLLYVEVYNDGRPIPPEQLPLLFQRFSRLPETGQVKGTGLGLFITKEIIEKH